MVIAAVAKDSIKIVFVLKNALMDIYQINIRHVKKQVLIIIFLEIIRSIGF